MAYRFSLGRAAAVPAVVVALGIALAGNVSAQGRRGGRLGAPPPPIGRAGAPIDLTGYWVSVVTEDWLYRMITPPKGDFASVPLNAEGRQAGNAWNPDNDIAAGRQCKSYGAAALMRVPGRLHITWQDEHTLKMETDAGMQTRLFRFPEKNEDAEAQLLGAVQAPAGIEDSLQGYSVGRWERAGGGQGPGGGFPGVAGQPAQGGSLEVVTTHLLPGYLRKNGVPYSGNTLLTEYYDRTDEDNGDTWLIITTIVHDPKYLTRDFITSTHFKKEPDGSKWNPLRCTAK